MLEIAYIYRRPITMTYNAHNSDPELKLDVAVWEEINELNKFLKIFYLATKSFSGVYFPTICEVLVYVCAVTNKFAEYKNIEKFAPVVEAMIQKF